MLDTKPSSGRLRRTAAVTAVVLGTAAAQIAVAEEVDAPAEPPTVADLPVAISSFGAAHLDGSLYVYGGHIGRQHVHSFENLSQLFLRHPVDLDSPGPTPGWLALPPGQPLQGTALIEHDGALYRVGGMRADNPRREPGELYSVKSAARFLPEENRWQRFMALPAGRSSHDLAVVGNLLVVAGGWELRGSVEDPLWERTVLALDLKALDGNTAGRWEVLTETPVGVRANAAVGLDGKLWVLGGLDDNGDTTRRVDIYDPSTDTWVSGPELPASGSLNGFGADAVTVHDTLLVSQADGRVYSIRSGENGWTHAGDLDEQRFFHRLVSDGESLYAIGGANRTGHLDSVERHSLSVLGVDPGVASDHVPSRSEADWTGFRNGGASTVEAAALPPAWTEPAWTVELPAFGHSGPVVWRGTAYVTSVTPDAEDAKDTLWLTAVAGNHGVGGSVLLTGDHAVVLLARKTYSYLLAVDRATGVERWKADREPGVSWTTPALSPDGREIAVSSNGSVEGYDARTGERLWWIPNVKSNTTQSPLITEELVIVSGSERPANFAIRRGARGELGEDDIVWRSESTAHFASPMLAGDCIYWANAVGVAQCIDPATGKSHWRRRLSQPAWVTPIAAGERVFFFGEKGATDVLSAGARGGEVLATSRVEVDEYLTGVAPAGDTLLLRSGKLLHAVRGEP